MSAPTTTTNVPLERTVAVPLSLYIRRSELIGTLEDENARLRAEMDEAADWCDKGAPHTHIASRLRANFAWTSSRLVDG